MMIGVLGYAVILSVAAAMLAHLIYRLRKQNALFREFFEHTPAAVSITGRDDRVTCVNRQFTRVFGYTAEAAVGRYLVDLTVPAESQEEYRRHVDLAAGGKPVYAEGIRRRQDGGQFPAEIAYVPISWPGQKSCIYTVCRDITEYRRAEEERRAGELWRAIIDSSAIGIAVTNPGGYFIAANNAYRELVGYSEEELRGVTFMDLTWEEDRPANAALLADMWGGKLSRFQIEKRYRRKDGQSIWVKITASNVAVAGAAAPVGMGLVEDITERKRVEARLRE
jgi:PAS domain S-box-containing protein